MENPTSRDIADIAGVSQATVSRALRNSPLVRQETRERVQQIARELNYFVNRNAAGLRTHQSSTIALLLFDEDGNADHEGETDILWNEMETVRSEDGRVTLICRDGHDWLAVMDEQQDI